MRTESNRPFRRTASAVALAMLFATIGSRLLPAAEDASVRWRWDLPPGFLEPWVPPSQALTPARVELGRHLFYDVRLSGNQTQSCATCHQQELAFTDGKGRAIGSTGIAHPRGSMSLLNVAYVARLTWANPTLALLEEQALVPLFGDAPVEMGLTGSEARFFAQMQADGAYQRLAEAAFPGVSVLTMKHVTDALAAFQRSLVSFRSPYDRYRTLGEVDAISASAKRGEMLFFSGEKAGCFQCHGGILFGGGLRASSDADRAPEFHNNGLYNVAGPDAYPAPNRGIFEHSGHREDMGKFRAPTLRNIAVTAPYMHDGSIPTLAAVIAHYNAGGRVIAAGPYAGDGRRNPNRSAAVRALALSDAEKADLLAFLESLTDEQALNDPRWSNPWPVGSAARP